MESRSYTRRYIDVYSYDSLIDVVVRPVRNMSGIRVVRYKGRIWPLRPGNAIWLHKPPIVGTSRRRAPESKRVSEKDVSAETCLTSNDYPSDSALGFDDPGFLVFLMGRSGTRLRNCVRNMLASEGLPFRSVEEYFSLSRQERIERLLLIQSLGLKTAREFDELVNSFVARLAAISSCIVADEPEGSAECSDVPQKDNQAVARKSPALPDVSPPKSADALTVWDAAISVLTPREYEVLKRRYALEGGCRETLEAVGKILNVTRERIRQIEKKALKKLRHLARGAFFLEFLSLRKENIEQRLFGPNVFCTDQRLTGRDRLAAEVAFGSIGAYLEQTFQLWQGLVVRSDVDLAETERAANCLRESICFLSKPRAFEAVAQRIGVTTSVLAVAVGSLKEFTHHKSYLVHGRATARKRRIMNVLTITQQETFPNPFDLWQLRLRYRLEFPEDRCSGRDLRISLEGNPAIFSNLREIGWLCLEQLHTRGNRIGHLGTSQLLSNASIELQEPIHNSDGLANKVFRVFEESGPLRLSELRRTFSAKYPEYSEASILPTLVIFPIFVRLAPGVIGYRAHLTDVDALQIARQKLLRTTDVDLFLYSRASAQPSLRYPLWDGVMEEAWANWLFERKDYPRLQALLASANLDSWSVSHADRQWWTRQRQEGIYTVEPPNPSLYDRRVGPTELEGMLFAAGLEGQTHWMHVNQALGWRVDTGRSALALALGCSAGWFDAPEKWWEPHRLTAQGWDTLWEALNHRREDGETFPFEVPVKNQLTCGGLAGWLANESCEELWACFGDLKLSSAMLEAGESDDDLDLDALYEGIRRRQILGDEEE